MYWANTAAGRRAKVGATNSVATTPVTAHSRMTARTRLGTAGGAARPARGGAAASADGSGRSVDRRDGTRRILRRCGPAEAAAAAAAASPSPPLLDALAAPWLSARAEAALGLSDRRALASILRRRQLRAPARPRRERWHARR